MSEASDLSMVHGRIGHLIRRCQQIAVSVFFDECKTFSITPEQYAALAMIGARPGIDQATLAGLVALDRSSTGKVVMRLETKKLVLRKPSSADRRYKCLFVTKAGAKLLERIAPYLDIVRDRLLEPLTADEREHFVALLSKVVDINNQRSRAPLLIDRPAAAE